MTTCHEKTMFWQWSHSLCYFVSLRAAALKSKYYLDFTRCCTVIGRRVWRWACIDCYRTDCILQSCGNEIGSHLLWRKKPQSNCYGLYLFLSLENRNKQWIFLMNLLYLPILFMGYTLPVDITLVNLLLYGQHLPHKYRIEKLYYICVWWNEVLPKLWCGEDLLCSLYLGELHAT